MVNGWFMVNWMGSVYNVMIPPSKVGGAVELCWTVSLAWWILKDLIAAAESSKFQLVNESVEVPFRDTRYGWKYQLPLPNELKFRWTPINSELPLPTKIKERKPCHGSSSLVMLTRSQMISLREPPTWALRQICQESCHVMPISGCGSEIGAFKRCMVPQSRVKYSAIPKLEASFNINNDLLVIHI